MRKILLSLMALLLVVGLVGTGLVADFWDIEVSDDNRFEAGTLDLKVSSSWSYTDVWGLHESDPEWSDLMDDPNVFHFNISQIEPCDEGEVTFNITNTGCLPGFLTVTVRAYGESGGILTEPELLSETLQAKPINGANMDEQLLIQMWQDDGDNVYEPGEGEVLLIDGLVIDELSTDIEIVTGHLLEPDPSSGKGVNNTKYLGFYWHLEEEDPVNEPNDYGNQLDNDIQGDDLWFDIEFYLVKAKGTAGPYRLANKAHDPAGVTNSTYSFCVDVENEGDAAGSTTLYLDLQGAGAGGSHNISANVPLGPFETKNVCIDWMPTVKDNYTVYMHCVGGDTEGPQYINIDWAPKMLVPPSNWQHDVSFYNDPVTGPGCGNYTDLTMWSSMLMALGVSAPDASPCIPVPLPGPCAQIDVDHGNGGVGAAGLPQRKPANCPAPITYSDTKLWASFGLGGEQSYRYLDGFLFGGPLRQEWGYLNYTLTSGTNIGKPYVVGNKWTYEILSAAMPGYPMGSCLSSWHWYLQTEVVASGVTKTVTAGTFNDCYQIDVSTDWNMNCAFEANELNDRHWWSPTAQADVLAYDYLTFCDPCQTAATCVLQGVCTNGTCVAPLGAPSDKIEKKELMAYTLFWV